jgi:hypothetical protein
LTWIAKGQALTLTRHTYDGLAGSRQRNRYFYEKRQHKWVNLVDDIEHVDWARDTTSWIAPATNRGRIEA